MTTAPLAPPPSDDNASTGGEAASGDRDTFVEISGVPGVTDDEIQYSVIGTKSNNPLGTCILDCYAAGVEAYFAYRNSEGGIYGRDLVVSETLDDELANNQVRALDVISADDTFGNFNATLAPSGWGDLDQAGIPTYVWGIHGNEMAGREHIFGHIQGPCSGCTGRGLPWIVGQAGAHRVATLGYGITETSRECAHGSADSFELYGSDVDAEAVYVKDDLAYGLPNGIAPEVTAMKDAGVDFIAGCIDLNGMKTLAQELERQGMDDVILYHPNTYDQRFVEENADLFEGDYVTVQFLPFEADAEGTPLDTFQEWMDETGGELSRAVDGGLDQRRPRLPGSAGRRSRVRPPVGGRRHQPDDRLRRRRAHQPHRLDPPARRRRRRRPQHRLCAGVRPGGPDPRRRLRDGRPAGQTVAVLVQRQPGLVRAHPNVLQLNPGSADDAWRRSHSSARCSQPEESGFTDPVLIRRP